MATYIYLYYVHTVCIVSINYMYQLSKYQLIFIENKCAHLLKKCAHLWNVIMYLKCIIYLTKCGTHIYTYMFMYVHTYIHTCLMIRCTLHTYIHVHTYCNTWRTYSSIKYTWVPLVTDCTQHTYVPHSLRLITFNMHTFKYMYTIYIDD